MKTFEEIFESIIEEREGKKTYENDSKKVFKNDDEEIEEYIKKEKIMKQIFDKFVKQVTAGENKLNVVIPVEEHSILLKRNMLMNKIMFMLKEELPSYCISVYMNVHEYRYPYTNKYELNISVHK